MGVRVGKGDALGNKGGSFGAPKGDAFLEEAMAGRRKSEPVEKSAPQEEGDELMTEASDNTERKKVSGALESEFEAALLQEAADIGLEITDDDLMTFVFRSFITKEVPIIRGKLHAVFRTTTGEDLSLINKAVSKAISDEPHMMQKELQNINTINIFARTLLKMGKPGALRDLPEKEEDKVKELNKMSPLILNKLSKRYNLIDFLLEKKLRDEDAVKN